MSDFKSEAIEFLHSINKQGETKKHYFRRSNYVKVYPLPANPLAVADPQHKRQQEPPDMLWRAADQDCV
jgi:hypothetical protein